MYTTMQLDNHIVSKGRVGKGATCSCRWKGLLTLFLSWLLDMITRSEGWTDKYLHLCHYVTQHIFLQRLSSFFLHSGEGGTESKGNGEGESGEQKEKIGIRGNVLGIKLITTGR